MSISWACAWPAPASTISAANNKAKARVIFFLVKNQSMRETGHNCRDFASNEPVTAAIFEALRLKKATHRRRWLQCPAKPLTKRVNNG